MQQGHFYTAMTQKDPISHHKGVYVFDLHRLSRRREAYYEAREPSSKGCVTHHKQRVQ